MRRGSNKLGRRSLMALLAGLAAVAVVDPRPALALDLDAAKAQGWIGERRDGYVGLVDAAAPAEARALVDQINAERRAAYESVARQNGVPREQVEALAGQKLIARAAPGTFVDPQVAAGRSAGRTSAGPTRPPWAAADGRRPRSSGPCGCAGAACALPRPGDAARSRAGRCPSCATG